ncbi:MAG: SCP2 sterol-binding domain-containing protein [Armatimonadota bacterium]
MKRYARLNPLFKNPSTVKSVRDLNLDQSMDALVRRLGGARESGSAEVYIVGGLRETAYRLEFVGGKGTVSKVNAGAADFAVRASAETWMEMAKGDLSPIDAFLTGRLEVHGDLGFGKRLFAKAASRGGERDLE